MNKPITITATVRKFPQAGGWVYLPTGKTCEDFNKSKPKWGLLPATFTVGETTWKRSLLPLADGTLFVALPKPIRTKEKIEVGDRLTIEIRL